MVLFFKDNRVNGHCKYMHIQPICVISRVQARINSINNFIKYKNKKKKDLK